MILGILHGLYGSLMIHLEKLVSIACACSNYTLLSYVIFFLPALDMTPILLNCCRKGDYYRYLAEFSTGTEKKAAADQSLMAYQVQNVPRILHGL